ncbi:MAG TPA: Fic family protein [Paraburkholderia sp.]|jgi:fido (protein-threonine AMPylation protein)
MPTNNAPSPSGAPALAAALKALKRLQDKHHGVIEFNDLTDDHRAILVKTGFLRSVMKGWYICSNPAEGDGESTIWYASFWAFISGYLSKRFNKRYCLNPEASLLLHTGNTTVPRQVTAVAKESGTTVLNLPFNTSLLVYSDEQRVPKSRVEVRGLQVWPVAEALCMVRPQFFTNHPREAEIALAMVRDSSELLTTLLAGDGQPTAAARLAGALQFMQRPDDAERIVASFAQAGITLRPNSPFELDAPSLMPGRERSPYVLRLRSMWAAWREIVIDAFPDVPGIQIDVATYLDQVDGRYVADAYNSLSIEGYQVTDELIARVARGDWNPEGDPEQQKTRDALAARGYYLAFHAVKASIVRIFNRENAGKVVQRDHHTWYGELFGPAVTAGILQRHQLAGYRTGAIFIRNSMHTPVPREAILDCLEALFELLQKEPHAGVRAVLGHHLFVFIHPYFDGNGRIGRFLMNTLLASGGYPWTVIRVSRRGTYMKALEQASVQGNIRPLATFIAEEMAQWTPDAEDP